MSASILVLASTLGLLSQPSWLPPLNPEVEIHLAHREARESEKDISGLELGLRAGIFPRLQDWLEFGLEGRVSETSLGGRPDAVQLGSGFSNKGLALSQAYLAFLYESPDRLRATLSVGKFQSAFLHSPLTWDSDYRPEGLYQSLAWNIPALKSQFRLHAGQWTADRVQASLTSSQDLRRSYMFLQGLEWFYAHSRHTKLRLASQIFFFYDLSERLIQSAVQRGNTGQFSPALLNENFAPHELNLLFSSEPLGVGLELELGGAINWKSKKKDRGFYASAQVGRPFRANQLTGRIRFLYNEPNVQIAHVLDNEWGYGNLRGAQLKLAYYPIEEFEIAAEGLWANRLQANLYQDRLTQILLKLTYQFSFAS